MIETFAPAKLNLYFHITGKREDGYHFLDSLVTFARNGDSLSLTPQPCFDLEINGLFGKDLARYKPETNLVVKAAQALAVEMGQKLDFKITLTKNLPLASGIGGGSADAAACLRLLSAHWGLTEQAPLLYTIARSLGQDIACCLASQNCYFRDIGTVTDPAPDVPLTHILLVNPGEALPTPSVFKAFKGPFVKENRLDPFPETSEDLAEALKKRENVLTDAACSLCPAISHVLSALNATENCLLARMSGSGATCFGLYKDRSSAREAAAILMKKRANWWISPTSIPAYPPSIGRLRKREP